jgi:hypothetical protein
MQVSNRLILISLLTVVAMFGGLVLFCLRTQEEPIEVGDASQFVWSTDVVRPLYCPPNDNRIEYDDLVQLAIDLNSFLDKLIDKNRNLGTCRIYVSPQSQNVVQICVTSMWMLQERDRNDLKKLRVFAQQRFEKLLKIEYPEY